MSNNQNSSSNTAQTQSQDKSSNNSINDLTEYLESYGIEPNEDLSYHSTVTFTDVMQDFRCNNAFKNFGLKETDPSMIKSFVNGSHELGDFFSALDNSLKAIEESHRSVPEIKAGWGSQHNFMLSHGIKPTDPHAYGDAKDISRAYKKAS
eukprot:Platyproteum_vivax@DN2951_c0_g1_i1.p1